MNYLFLLIFYCVSIGTASAQSLQGLPGEMMNRLVNFRGARSSLIQPANTALSSYTCSPNIFFMKENYYGLLFITDKPELRYVYDFEGRALAKLNETTEWKVVSDESGKQGLSSKNMIVYQDSVIFKTDNAEISISFNGNDELTVKYSDNPHLDENFYTVQSQADFLCTYSRF